MTQTRKVREVIEKYGPWVGFLVSGMFIGGAWQGGIDSTVNDHERRLTEVERMVPELRSEMVHLKTAIEYNQKSQERFEDRMSESSQEILGQLKEQDNRLSAIFEKYELKRR